MSRKQKFKARDKVTRKMSRDGLVERNAVTGEDILVSKREADADLKGGKRSNDTFFQLDKRPDGNTAEKKKQKQRQIAENSARNENTHDTDVQPQSAAVTADTPKQADTPLVSQSETSEREEVRYEQPLNRNDAKPAGDGRPLDPHHVPQKAPPVKSKPPPVIGETPIITEPTTIPAPQTEKAADALRSPLKHDDSGKLQFERDDKPAPNSKRRQKSPQSYKPEVAEQSNTAADSLPPTVRVPDAPQSVLKHEDSDKLQFEHDVKPVPASQQRQKPPQMYKPELAKQSNTAADSLPPTMRAPDTARTSDAPPSALKHEDSGKLQFEHDVKPVAANQQRQKLPQKYKPEITEHTESDTTADNLAPMKATTESQESPPLQSEVGKQPLKHDKTGKLHFEPTAAITPPSIKPKQEPVQSQATQPVAETKPTEAPVYSDEPTKPTHTDETADIPDMTQDNDNGTDSPLHPEKTDAPLHTDKADAPLKPDKPGKLRFSEDETPAPPTRSEAKQQRKYGKAQKQTDRAVQKLDTAKSKLPAKKKLRSERVFNEKSGKAKRRLYFESEVKSQGEHLKGALPLRPVKMAGNSALAFGHRKMFQVERENVATEAAHKAETAVEGGVRMALHHHKTAPYRKVQKLEQTVRKKSIKAAYQKALAENPKLKSNLLSRAFQKRKIKKDYAKAAREAQKAAKRAKKAGSAVSSATKAVAGVIKRHPVAAAVIILVLLLLFCLMSLIGAFGSAGSGGLGAILSASYLAEDIDIDNAEVAYTEWEVDLQQQIANTESSYPGYDEYRYNIGDISHNPYELMAFLTVKYQNFTYAAIESDLRAIFGEQYSLTITPSVETRYADPNDTDEDGDYEPYEWNVLTISLMSRSFTDVASLRMSGDEMAHYALLLQTKGSRQYVGNPFGTDWLAYVTSYYGYRVHPISGAKDLHRGVDIGFPAGTQILSAQDGTVTFAGYSGDYGNVVVIENADGFVTKYAHCETLLVSAGQTVSTGVAIATVGSTGNSTGPHLHFEVLKNGVYLNPLYHADTGSLNLNINYGYAGTPMGDGSYAALIAEAEQFLGFPYVWGGSSPSTSFDCSGFVSWTLTQSGVRNTGRLGAQGLFNICNPVSPADARPGDLIFFTGTYSAPLPVTHVGIYVGTDATGRPRMLHCGNPIQYTYIDTSYWQSHFYAFGRV